MSTANLVLNGEPHEIPEGTTVAGLLASLDIDVSRVAVERNRVVIRRKDHGSEVLAEGDEVEIVTFVGGG